MIVIVTLTGAIVSVILALSITNRYTATVLLMPQEGTSANSLAGIAGQLSSIASLTGLQFGANDANNTVVSLATIKSKKFIKSFVNSRNLVPAIMASDGWDSVKNEILLDQGLYDEREKKWVRDVSPPKTQTPSDSEVYEEFFELFSIEEDPQTGLIRISIEHYSPFWAADIANSIVEDLNDYLREVDIKEAQTSINYLNELQTETAVAELRQVFYQLIEEQTKKIMLAKSRKDYALKIVDPAVVSDLDDESYPNRPVFCLSLTLFFFIMAIGFSLYKRN